MDGQHMDSACVISIVAATVDIATASMICLHVICLHPPGPGTSAGQQATPCAVVVPCQRSNASAMLRARRMMMIHWHNDKVRAVAPDTVP
eukprot:6179045-Pleurochrysis_carterae.AAC.3